MIVRRALAGVLALGLAVPLLAAASRDARSRKDLLAQPPPAGMGMRVFARADGIDPSPIPGATAAPDGPGPAAKPSPEVAARARVEFDANRAGKIDRSHYSAEMNAALTDGALAEASVALRALGDVKSFAQVRRISQGPLVVYVFRIAMEKPPAVEEEIAWNAAGKIEYLRFGAGR